MWRGGLIRPATFLRADMEGNPEKETCMKYLVSAAALILMTSTAGAATRDCWIQPHRQTLTCETIGEKPSFDGSARGNRSSPEATPHSAAPNSPAPAGAAVG